MKPYNEDKSVLLRILDNIANIETLLATMTEASFLSELKDFNAICLELIQIGEKVNQLSPELYDDYPEVPWHELYGLRNRIVHGYDKINKDIIWATLQKDIPEIKNDLINIVSSLF